MIRRLLSRLRRKPACQICGKKMPDKLDVVVPALTALYRREVASSGPICAFHFGSSLCSSEDARVIISEWLTEDRPRLH